MLNQITPQPYEKIASIGCAGGLWEIAWSFELDQIEFYLQEIDDQLLNEIEVNETLKYFEKQFNKTTNCKFKIAIGDHYTTNLPANYFDKVLLINSFHEFKYQNNMLNEFRRILKPDGQLIIEEQIAQYYGELHQGCGKKLFLFDELIHCFNKNGFDKLVIKKNNNKLLLVFKIN